MKEVGFASKPRSESQSKFQNITQFYRLMNPVWEKNEHKKIM